MPFRWCRAGCITICREENQPFWVGGGRQLTLDQMFPWTTTTLPPWWWSWLWWSCWWRSPWVAKTRLLGHQMPLLMSLWAACHSQTIIHTTITTITTITIGIYSVCHHHHLLPNFRLTSSSPLDTSFWVGRISHLGHQMDPVSMSHNVTQSHHTIHKGHEKWKTNQHSVQTYSDQCRTVQSSNRKELLGITCNKNRFRTLHLYFQVWTVMKYNVFYCVLWGPSVWRQCTKCLEPSGNN